MQLICYESHGQARYGMIEGAQLYPLMTDPQDRTATAALLCNPTAAVRSGETLPATGLRHLPPVLAPAKILCVATNFHEGDKPTPDHPLIFTRYADSFTGHDQPLRHPPETTRFDFEGELAVIIGKPGFHIAREAAFSHVAGYTCANDGSARDWQKHSSQFTPGKNFLASGGIGPWMVTPDQVPDLAALRLETRVNGVIRQAIGLDRMIFDVPWLIAYLSTFTPLGTGDVILTGTPSGFGATRNPPEFLNPGDVVEVEIPGIGLLRNPVASSSIFVM